MPTSNLYNYENKIRCPCLLINLYRRPPPPPKKKINSKNFMCLFRMLDGQQINDQICLKFQNMNSNNCVIQKISIIFFLLTLGIFLYICIFIWISSLKEDKNSLKMAMTSSPLNISNVITIMNCWAVLLKIKEVHLTRKQRLELPMICQAVNYYLGIKVYKFQA